MPHTGTLARLARRIRVFSGGRWEHVRAVVGPAIRCRRCGAVRG